MAKEAKRDSGKLVVSLCAVIAAVIIIAVAIVVIATNHQGLDDSYFVSDDTKYVLSLDISEDQIDQDDESAQYAPLKTHMVYDYKEDTITAVRVYYEYDNNADAKKAYDYMLEIGEDENYEDIYVDGKYIVTVAPETEYKELTASDVKQAVDFMEALKEMDSENLTMDDEE